MLCLTIHTWQWQKPSIHHFKSRYPSGIRPSSTILVMSSQVKPIKIWGSGGPNPLKVLIILEELDLPHEIQDIPFTDVKKPEYTAINPNGRVPSIQDPNTNITLWESGAIIEYLVEKYDTKHKISFPTGSDDSYLAKQWLIFQVSGQGPYFGQAAWFTKFHSEKLPSALDRYVNEANRVTGVLESWLSKQKDSGSGGADGPWLVGGKCSHADLAFITWHKVMQMMLPKENFDEDKFPHVKEWIAKMCERKSVKTVRANANPSF